LKLVLFDADGTLIDSQAIIHASMTRTFEDFGHRPPSLFDTKSIVGLSLEIAIARLLDRLRDEMTCKMTAKYKANFLDLVELPEYETRLFPGIRDLIETLSKRENVLIGMVTGKSRAGIDRFLDSQGFRPHFVTSRCADDCPSKPHPAMVLECCDDVGIEPASSVVIGDTSFDIEMAKSAGATALGVAWGYHDTHLLEKAGANDIAHTADDLLTLIDDHPKRENSYA